MKENNADREEEYNPYHINADDSSETDDSSDDEENSDNIYNPYHIKTAKNSSNITLKQDITNFHIIKDIKEIKFTLKNFLSKLLYYIPIIFIIAVIPLITFGKIVELPIEEANFWKGGLIHVDFFSYYKSSAFVIATCAAFAASAILYLNKKITIYNDKKYYAPMLLYALLVILSTIFSQNKNVAILGFIEMYQGMSVLLCYILLSFILMNILKDKKDLEIIFYSFTAISLITGILGLSQYFGFDFFQTSVGSWLILPNALKGADLKFTFGKYTIYGTMYNTNFVGSFGAIILPITTALFMSSESAKKKTIFYTAAILSFATWLGCNSRAGYIGIGAAAIIGAVIFRKVIKEKLKKTSVLLIGFIAVAIIFNVASNGRQLGQFIRLNPVLEAEKIEKIRKETQVRFEEISVKDNTFTIKTTKETLIGTVNDEDITFNDEKNNTLEYTVDSNGSVIFADEKYKEYKLKISDTKLIEGLIYGRPLNLYALKDNNNMVKAISFNNKLIDPINAPHLKIFDNRETFASNRGYIWSRTVPMLKDTVFIGYGPDNYCMMYPQEDYVGRFNTGRGMTNIVVDKPHNMYLQTAINTGVLSLLSLLFIWAIYIIDSLKLYIDGNIKNYKEYMGAAVFLSITAYLTAGIFNDNIISVAPLFWAALGAGISINNMNKIDKSCIQ